VAQLLFELHLFSLPMMKREDVFTALTTMKVGALPIACPHVGLI
jgi:hypothetical protein